MLACRLIVDSPSDSAWNMALDEALLESAESEQLATLRFYRWREPTLSLGYFQSYSDRQSHSASATCTIVRRATGGGAILHHQELTYSIALPRVHPLATRAEHLYLAVHQSLVDMLAAFGVPARYRKESEIRSTATDPAPERFLCFQRATFGDVLIGPHKIAGSAQRRRRGAVLQHGSILLQKSIFAPELAGILDLTAIEISAAELLEVWPSRLAQILTLPLGKFPDELPQSLVAAAEKIAQEKFATSEWTQRR